MIWKTKSLKKLLLFLETQPEYIASHEDIENTFPDEMNVDKIISEALEKNWIVKTPKNQYKLTKTGEYEIQKMTKKLQNEITVDFKVVKIIRCASCGENFPTKSRQSWCPQCRRPKKKRKFYD